MNNYYKSIRKKQKVIEQKVIDNETNSNWSKVEIESLPVFMLYIILNIIILLNKEGSYINKDNVFI